MAMTHLQLQPVLLLLASLFFIPALHGAIDFKYCDTNGNDYANINRIEISQNTDVITMTISVYASASKFITERTFVYVTIESPESSHFLRKYNVCEVSTCNIFEHGIVAGTNFVLTLPAVAREIADDDEEFTYAVSLRQEELEEPIMCVDFKPPALVSA